MKRTRIIQASELTDYGFCAQSWWLRRIEGIVPGGNGRRMRDGEALHQRHGIRVAAAPVLRTAAVAVLISAVLLLLISAL
ncbi:MAG: hypothetical protein NTZ50_08315 [Chloroflexi bacterium]|nr:hypothetical protein [Chloroflexota bacterium]